MKLKHNYNKKKAYREPAFKSKKIKVFFRSRFINIYEPFLLANDDPYSGY